ncbi:MULTISPECIES: IclR family transcriptional regulator [Burkholderia]|uniref:IclR family transcriptional regulator n=1 Tax=Burkholderia TaxID=32008 RepID=UPI000841A83D
MNSMNHQPAAGDAEPREGKEAGRYRAPALDKGLDILELLADQREGLTRAEITKHLGRNASEIYRMLERLVARHYVVRSANGERYTLSLKLYALAHRHPPLKRLITAALPPMQRFADAAEQSCHLCVYDRGNLLVIAQVEGPGPCVISVRLGTRVRLVESASGPVLLTFQTDEQRAQMLAEHAKTNSETAPDMHALNPLIASIHTAGSLRRDSRQACGVIDISYPVLGPFGQAIAALTCPYMRRIDTHAAPSIDEVDARLRDAATHLSMISGQSA